MKKHLLFLFTALTLMLVPTALKAQTTVTIGDESSGVTAYILPVNMYFNYSLTQQIYTAAEINMSSGGTITAISFEYTSTAAFSLGDIEVYMKNVSKDHFESNTDMVEVTSSDRVFSGTFSASGAGWVTITLNTPFHYDGTSNLLVCLYDPTEGYPGNTYTFRCTSTGNNSSDPKLAVTYNSDTYIPDLSNIHTYQGGKALQSYRSNIRLTINPDITDIYITGFTPPIWNGQPTIILSTPTSDPYSVKTSLCIWQDVTNNPANIFTGYVFNKEGHDYALKIYIEADNGYHFANDVTVHINGGTELVKTSYLDGAYYVAQTIPFHTTRGNNVSIGESTSDVTTNTPYNSVWGYSFVEQVYTADELGVTTGGEISCIRFNMLSAEAQTNHITVYMKNVSRSEFSGTSDYEAVTTDDIVYEGNYTFANGWNSIPLATPFHYNGTDNLMIAVHENTPGYSSRYFYYTEKANSVLSYRSDSNDPDPYDLSSFSGNRSLSQSRADIKIDIHPTTTVNNGTNTNNSIPVYGFWADSYLKAEFVMPAASLTDIPSYSKITGMTFYTNGDATYQDVSWGDAYFKVFLKEVTDATLSDFTGDADATIVYEGALSVVDGKMTVPFSTNPYTYHGDNLLVGVYNMVNGSYQTLLWRGVTTPGASVSGYSTTSLNDITATQQNFLPKTTFNYTAPSNFIDFETATLSQFPFNNTGTYPWIVVSDGYNSAYCMRSGNTGVANSTSTIEATYTFAGNGSISFDANCMGEGTNTYWDHCDFSIDGELQFTHGADFEDWNHYTFNVTAGTHTFTWSYIKDNSVNPTGDGFFVDNIEFDPGVPCSTPENLAASNISSIGANLSWTEAGSASEWQICLDGDEENLITATTNPYTLTGLTPETSYSVKVRANCGSDITSSWSESITFTTTAVPVIYSTANWYAYAGSSYDNESWGYHCINFSMQDPSTVAIANSDDIPNINAAAYADGYMWYISIYNFGKAVLDNNSHTISNFQTIVSGFESKLVEAMSYNPTDGKMYYIDVDSKLKRFDPTQPDMVIEIGTTSTDLNSLAINSAGVAYGVKNSSTGELYQVDLTDASTTLIGTTGLECFSTQGMAFDMETGELFWAQKGTDNSLYLVNTETAETYNLGRIGGGNGGEFAGLFMVGNTTPSCTAPSDLTVSYITDNSARLSWTENGTATEWQVCVNGNEGNPIDVTESPYILTGLTPDMSYTVKVRANCGDAVSDWSAEESFTTMEETIVSDFIDFETNDFSQHPFNQDASYPWIIVDASNGCDNGSAYCMKSGNEGEPSSTSTIVATHDFSEDGYISFDAKCMGEGEDFDVCRFYIDGNLELYHGNDLGGWNQFAFAVTAGTHIFTWSYTKDGSVNPDGDGFFVDNIEFGTGMPCVAAWGITVNAVPDGNATVTWQGYSDSYTLQYMLEGSGDWNTVEDITDLSYDITGLAIGNYVVRVAADCDPGNWASTTFSVVDVNSTANWYAYALYSSDGESWEQNCINFSMQDPSTVAEANWDVAPMIYAATYADGYMWYFNTSGDLGRAVVDNENQTISDFETIVPGLEPSTNAPTSMSYNPIDGRIYYNDYSIYTLKSFDPAHPEMATETGTTSISIQAFAINSAGEAYCVENLTGNLYHLDLTDASTTLVGPTGYSCDYVQAMAFDMETGELFWAHYDAGYSHSIYLVNTATAETYSLGSIGGGNGGEFAGLFMVGNTTPTCPAPTNLEATNTTQHTAELSWTENGTASEWQIMVNFNEGDIIDVYGNPYILDNLTAETEYTVMVRANCGGMWSDWSNEAHILTEVGCPATEDLTMMEFTSTTATLNWTGVGESFDLRYRASDGDWVEMEDVFPPYTLIGLMPNTSYEVQVMNDCGTEGLSLWSNLADFTTSDCPAPMALTANNITKHTAELSWTENGSATEWQIMVNHEEGDIIDVYGNPYILENLNAYTEYTVQVRANCGSGFVSDWSDEVHFITQVGCQPSNDLSVESVSYNSATLTWSGEGESFNVEYSLLGSGTWETFNDVLPPYTITGLTPGSDYEVHVIGNCGTDGLSDWSNTVEFTTLTCPMPSGLTVTNVTKHTADLSWTENGSSTEWEISLASGSDVEIIPVTGAPSYSLTGLAANTEYTVMVQSNCEGSWSGWGETISFITPIGCEASNDLAVTDATYNTATLTWTGEGESYNLQYRTASGTWVMVENVTSSYTLEELTSNTNYEVQVQNNCGTDGLSDWSNLVTFTTLTCPAPTELTVTNTTKHTAVLSWIENGSATEWQMMVNNDEDNLINVTVNPFILDNLAAETEYTVMVRANCGGTWSDWSNEAHILTEVGCQTTNDLAVMSVTPNTVTLDWSGEGETYDLQFKVVGDEWVLVEDVFPPYTLIDLVPNTSYEVQVMNDCGTEGTSLWSNTVTFITTSCPVPTYLTATSIDKHSAILTWNETGEATEWQIMVNNDEDDLINVSTNPYTLENLAAETEYTVKVRANCGGFWSDWSNEENFITPIGCQATNDLEVTNETYGSATLTWSGEGESFNVQYRTASEDWVLIEDVTSPYTLTGLTPGTDYEVQVQNYCGTDGFSNWSNLVTFTTLICPTPTGLTVTNVTKNSAVISWTENGSATVWQLHIDNHYIGMLDVYENPYTLTGLNAGTEYTVQVVAYCGAILSDLSEELTFTTDIPCHATEDLHVTAVTPNSATLDWTGEGDNFEMQYRISDGEWVSVSSVTPPYTLTNLSSNTNYEVQVRNICSGLGASEWSNTATFATSLCPAPANLTVTNITKNSAVLSWTETGTATAWELSIGNYHINLLDIGENPYTLTELSAGTEYTVKVSAVCGASWSDWSNEVSFTTEVACTPTEDLAVTDYTYNTATLNWTGEGNVFHLRHRIPGGEWIATDGIVPPYTLTGLNPGTTYEAQVQNECIGGNQSEWSNLVTFTTSACDPQAIPYAYDFETEEPFYCWSQVAGDVELIQALPSQNHTPNGEYSLAFYESASDVIAFPQFTQEVNTLQVSFWVRPHNITMSGYGTFSVGYLTDVNDASTFTAVSTYSYDEWPGTIDFLRKIVTLQDAPAGAIIAFKHDSPTANGTWYVDDILVSAICDVPTGITVTNITNHSATVTWTDNGASSWDVTLNSSMGYATNVTNNQYTFDNLTPGTNNYVMVRSRCGDDIISNWSEQVTFTTLENSIPTYATITGDSTVCYLSTTLLTAHTDVPATYLWSNGATTQQINVGAGTYQVTVTSATGDELASEPFTLTENPSLSGEESRSICPSELPYTWNGHTFPETGMAFVTLTASNGCDSIVTMILSVNPTFNDTIEATICEGESYHFAGQDLTESGVYTDSLQTIKGCDSMTVLTLIVNPSYALTVEQTVCESELPIVWNGKTFNEAGTQTATLQTVNECDSVVTMTLHVNPTYNIPVEATICSGQSYNFHGQILTAGGEYTHPMQTVNGCDSVEVLTLTVNPTYSVSEERSVCSGALPYTWNGIVFNAPGTKFATLQTVNGCDSVVTMILSVSDAYEVTVTQTVCASELPIVWNGKTFTEAGTQIAELVAGNGCDSIVTMVLTVNTPVNTATTAEACGSYTWAANGQTYTESGTHYYEHPDAHGCTQVDTLHLTIYTPTNAAITEAVCGSYTWTDGNGVTYTESGTYYYEHQDAHNCTQVDTLYLTIYTPTNTAITETACGSYTWTGGDGVTYTESGTHYYEHPDAHGCTQVDTLYLTINNPVNTVTTEESCGNYTWAANGQTYYASGEYTYSHTDANGCTQVDTLRLTILQGSSAVVANTICASELPYEWNGVTFTAAGMQTATIEAANGCDSVVTMVLTVNAPR